MDALVIELQREAMSSESEITSLLRKCVLIATKLKQKDFLEWANRELRGYGDDDEVPQYRYVATSLKGYNPFNGLWLPVLFQEGTPEWACKRAIYHSVAEIQAVMSKSSDHIELSLPEAVSHHLMRTADMPRPPVFHVSINRTAAILDSVRNLILEWSLKLEADGILGEGMAFNQQEKQAAMSNTYNIENFTGIIGAVTANSVTIANYDDLHKKLKDSGVPQSERVDLERIMDEIPKAHGESKKQLVEKALTWVVKNGPNLGALSTALHTWIQNQNQ